MPGRIAGAEPALPLAFPGAEGFGARARGGAGGRELVVTTRADTGREGSLRWALAQPGPRVVRFQVGGLFELDSNLRVTEPFLTLDGSEVSQQAIPHAVTLAKQTGASVILVQVVDSEAQMIMRTAGATIEPFAF